ncbi:YfhO family protein [bacterium]|nr:YfhO family protein [bacterium]
MNRKQKHVFGYVVLLLLPTLIMAGPLWRGAIPYFMDPVMYFFPLRVHAARVLHGGEWPLWNRCLMGGMPLFENPQAALAYPFHWPFLAWPNGFWFLWPMLLQLGLYAALTVWALRRIGAGPAAWFGGALALAGSYGWSRLQYGNYMNILPWWPLWLGAAHAYVESGRRKWIVAGAIALAMSIVGGAHQLAAYGIALLLVYAVVQIVAGPDVSRPSGTRDHVGFFTRHCRGGLKAAVPAGLFQHPARIKWLIFIIISFSLGLLISAPGWLPQWGFIRQTSRPGGLSAPAVLEGAIGSFGELLKALIGDWGSIFREGWADAELAVMIGPVALIMAFFIPQRGNLRKSWIACWIAAVVAIALASRMVMAPLLHALPVAGIFHGPRRWLGVAQYFLILASALSASSLVISQSRSAMISKILIVIFVIAIICPAYFTWKKVECRTIAAGELLKPERTPLILQAGLRPGERFFSIDYLRDSSYNYRRQGVTEFALPNFSMLWGVEDLGGYEPAQTARYSEFMDRVHEPEPWRRPWANHFGLIENPLAAKFIDEGNVRAAIMPRWGVPMFFRPVQPEISVARGAWANKSLRAIMIGPANAQARLIAISGSGQKAIGGAQTHPISAADDQAASSVLKRTTPPGEGRIVVVPFATGETKADALAIQHPQSATLIDGYAWGAAESDLWKAGEMGEVAVLMEYRGKPEYASWRTILISPVGRGVGNGTIKERKISANKVELDIETAGGEMVIHDAWWPGWRATVDGKPVEIGRDGLWRAIQVPAGARRVDMSYRPPLVAASVAISGCGLALLVAVGIRRRRIDPALPAAVDG